MSLKPGDINAVGPAYPLGCRVTRHLTLRQPRTIYVNFTNSHENRGIRVGHAMDTKAYPRWQETHEILPGYILCLQILMENPNGHATFWALFSPEEAYEFTIVLGNGLEQHIDLNTRQHVEDRYKTIAFEDISGFFGDDEDSEEVIEEDIEEVEECPICYEPIKSYGFCTTNCDHTFCMDCMVRHLQINQSCPLCRDEVAPPPDKKQYDTDTYEEGFEAGYEQSIEDNEVHAAEIHQQGYREGQNQGYQEGHTEGFQHGLQKGCEEGYERGFQIGQALEGGYDRGFQAGTESVSEFAQKWRSKYSTLNKIYKATVTQLQKHNALQHKENIGNLGIKRTLSL